MQSRTREILCSCEGDEEEDGGDGEEEEQDVHGDDGGGDGDESRTREWRKAWTACMTTCPCYSLLVTHSRRMQKESGAGTFYPEREGGILWYDSHFESTAERKEGTQ